MDLSKLKGRAQDAARTLADSDHAQRVRDSDVVRRVVESDYTLAAKTAAADQTEAAKHLAADQVAKLGPRLHDLVVMDEDRPLTPEALLLKLISAVHSDGEIELSLQDVRGMGKRNERLVAAAGIVGGGAGCIVADMYADAALYCLLVDCFSLDLSDADIAARLLVAWGALPDSATARAAMDPANPATIAGEARKRLRDEIRANTKKESVRTLWRLRSGVARIPTFEPSTFRDLFFAGHALQERLDTAALQLGLPPQEVKNPGLFRRQRIPRASANDSIADVIVPEPHKRTDQLFSRRQRSSAPELRSAQCIYEGESFPSAGEPMSIAGIRISFLLDRQQLPLAWTDLVEVIRERTQEPARVQVQTNILGGLLAMVDNSLGGIGIVYECAPNAERASGLLRTGNNSIVECRSCLAQCAEAFDFEVIKGASLLASEASRQSRADAGYPYPDLWPHSLSDFSFA